MAGIRRKTDSTGKPYFIVRVSLGRDTNDKQIFKTTVFHPTKREGTKGFEKELNTFTVQFEEKVRSGKFYDEKISFQEFTEQVWKPQYAENNLTIAQQERYTDVLKKVIYPAIGTLPVAKVTAMHLQGFVDTLKNKDSRRGGKLSVGTIKRYFSIMSCVFQFAFKMNLILENPCKRVTLPKEQKEEKIHAFNEDQAGRFLQFLTDGYDIANEDDTSDTQHHDFPLWAQCYFYIAVYGGLRRGEQICLTWNDIDFEKEEITVSKSAKLTNEGIIIGKPKTQAGNRTIKLPHICFELLKQLSDIEKQLCINSGDKWNGKPLDEFKSNYIFVQSLGDKVGEMMDTNTPYHSFKKIIHRYNEMIDYKIASNDLISSEEKEKLESEKLPDIRLHDLRHTNATLLLSEGTDIETTKRRLGHSKASTTINIYGHPLQKQDEIASDNLEKAIKQADKERKISESATIPVTVTPEELEIIRALRKEPSDKQHEVFDKITKSDKKEIKIMA